MSGMLIAQAAAEGPDSMLLGLAMVGGGIAIGGGALGAAVGDGLVGASMIQGVARQPEAAGRLNTTMFLIIGLCRGHVLHQPGVHGAVRVRHRRPVEIRPADDRTDREGEDERCRS